jgi:NitT/TauT family transport system substrate-binding protein
VRRALLGLVAVLVLASGCASSGQPTTPERTHVTVTSLPIVDVAPLYLAQQNGFFRDAGLDVTIKPLTSSPQGLTGLADGSVDIVAGANYVSYLEEQARGDADLRIVAEAALASPGLDQVVVSPRSGIRDASQLAGRTIAVNTPPPNIQTLALDRVLAARGVDPRTVRYVPMPFAQAVTALGNGSLDAAWLVEPFVTQAEQAVGALPVVDPASGPTAALPLDGYFTTSRFAEQFPNTVAAFRSALARGAALAANSRATTAALPGFAPVDGPTATLITLPNYPTTVRAERIQRVADLMTQAGMIDRRLDVASLIAGGSSS